jgi:hypothetical protein
MSVYDEESAAQRQIPVRFDTDSDPLDVFAELRVYVPFDSGDRGRHPIQDSIPAHPGQWICVYSSMARLADAHDGEDVEYSVVKGSQLLAYLADGAGIWLDRCYPGGRKILLPPMALSA